MKKKLATIYKTTPGKKFTDVQYWLESYSSFEVTELFFRKKLTRPRKEWKYNLYENVLYILYKIVCINIQIYVGVVWVDG